MLNHGTDMAGPVDGRTCVGLSRLANQWSPFGSYAAVRTFKSCTRATKSKLYTLVINRALTDAAPLHHHPLFSATHLSPFPFPLSLPPHPSLPNNGPCSERAPSLCL